MNRNDYVELNDEIVDFFDNFIKKGYTEGEREIVPNLKIKLKVLNTEELLSAESILLSMESKIPADTLSKVRSASILSLAIITLNDSLIDRKNNTEQENLIRRRLLYRQILKMPAIIVQKMYMYYIELVQNQNLVYSDMGNIGEKSENFSEHHSEK